jgi:hypothetical protein
MNLEFVCLTIIFALLVLLITFGDSLTPSGWTYLLSTGTNSISAKSITNTIKI